MVILIEQQRRARAVLHHHPSIYGPQLMEALCAAQIGVTLSQREALRRLRIRVQVIQANPIIEIGRAAAEPEAPYLRVLRMRLHLVGPLSLRR